MQVASDEFEKIKADYTKLEKIIEEIDNTIETKKASFNETILNIEKFEGQINVIREQINSAKNNESYINQRIDSVNEEIKQQGIELENAQREKTGKMRVS